MTRNLLSSAIDGFEEQFAVNHLGHFLLTNLLLPRLKTSTPSRIVILSSIVYMFGRINKDDLSSEKKYSEYGAYNQSKLANLLFMRKLVELLKDTGVTVNSLHPGIVRTDLLRCNRKHTWLFDILFFFLRFIIKTPRAGAQTSLRLALDPTLETSTGGFYADSIRWPMLTKAKNLEMADWLWSESEKMVGMRPRTPKDSSYDESASSVIINDM